MREKTVRAQHHEATCRMLEKTYGCEVGSIYYIDLPYEEPPRSKPEAKDKEVKPTKPRGRKRKL